MESDIPGRVGRNNALDHVLVPLGSLEVEGAIPRRMVEQCSPDQRLHRAISAMKGNLSSGLSKLTMSSIATS